MLLQLDDFENFASLFGRWGGQFHQLSRGSFRGTAKVAGGKLIQAFEANTNQDILTRGRDNADFATFIPITHRNDACRWQGRQLLAGQLIAKRPEVAYHANVRRDSLMSALLVPIGLLHDAMRILCADDDLDEIDPWAAIDPSAEKMKRFKSSMDALLTLNTQHQPAIAGPEGHVLESECLRQLVDLLTESKVEAKRPSGHDSPSRPVRHVIDFMHAHLNQPLTAITLCGQSGVSDRALRRYFRERFGMGPLAYHRIMRMHAARDALKATKGADGSVTDIARRFGFTRLGAFAAEYRIQFGELPSETLGVRGFPGVQGLSLSHGESENLLAKRDKQSITRLSQHPSVCEAGPNARNRFKQPSHPRDMSSGVFDAIRERA